MPFTAPDPLCRELNLGAFSEWGEEERIAFLERELEGKRPLLPARMVMSPEVRHSAFLPRFGNAGSPLVSLSGTCRGGVSRHMKTGRICYLRSVCGQNTAACGQAPQELTCFAFLRRCAR